MIGKGGVAALAVVALAVLGYWYWSPLNAMRQMQPAARHADAAAFNAFVDYPRVRDSLKRQLATRFGHSMGATSDATHSVANAAAALGAALGTAVASPLVDAAVQPSVVMRAIEQGQLRPRLPPTAGADAQSPSAPAGSGHTDALVWSAEHEGADHYVAYVRRIGDPEDQRIGFVLERRGFTGWQLTEVRVAALQR